MCNKSSLQHFKYVVVVLCVLCILLVLTFLNKETLLTGIKYFKHNNGSEPFVTTKDRNEILLEVLRVLQSVYNFNLTFLHVSRSTNSHAKRTDYETHLQQQNNDANELVNETKQGGNIIDTSLCDENSRKLVGQFQVVTNMPTNITESADYFNIEPGGSWHPSECHANKSTAIVIPYRNRCRHLQVLLYYVIPMLQRQQIDFRIFVVEQFGNTTFNQGLLENAGFLEASKLQQFDCVIFHDVDMIPEHDHNLYTCQDMPIHMCPALDKFGYGLPYDSYVGAVLQIPTKVFLQLNGYSNMYWGWGGEDDDMYARILAINKTVLRPPKEIGKYKMVKHDSREPNPERIHILNKARTRFNTDGLNSAKYNVIFVNNSRLYTHIMVDAVRH